MRRKRTWNWPDVSEVWPALLLMLVVAIPAACVVWFTQQAMRTERLAAQQKLSELYLTRLKIAAEHFTNRVRLAVERVEELAGNHASSDAFRLAIADKLCTSLLVFEPTGEVCYPRAARPRELTTIEHGAWADAQRLEAELNDYRAAAAAYQQLAASAPHPAQAARALQAQVRCLGRGGQTAEALRVITQDLGKEVYRDASDATGRSLVAAAELYGLQLLANPDAPEFLPLARRLADRLVGVPPTPMPSGQRRFLARQLMNMPNWTSFFPDPDLAMRLMDAEEIAAQYVASHPTPPTDSSLRPTNVEGIWALGCEGGRAVVLFSGQRLIEFARPVTAGDPMDTSYALTLLEPNVDAPPDTFLMNLVRGFAGWRFAITVRDPGESSDLVAAERITTYLWTGVILVSVMVVLAMLIGRAFRNQARLARLKNDLVATVTHELKTPLASMRLLLDTLLDTRSFDESKIREYLELVAKENTRLTRLIDNFLTFSRMERRKHSFHFADHSIAKIVADAVEAAGERFHSRDCRLDVLIASELDTIHADADALVTVLLNLLDNAYKYSQGIKRIGLRVERCGEMIRFSVSDNGIGLTRTEQRRVFERFYQADQSLTRPAGGCGLGLSIVEFIVSSHQGRILVESQPGQGSTFHVLLPTVEQRVAPLEEAVA